MFNMNSPIIQNMINTGQLGTMGPLQSQYYNKINNNQYVSVNMNQQMQQPQISPYGNMIPIGQTNYNNNYGYNNYGYNNCGYGYNMYNNYNQPNNAGMVFTPVNGGFDNNMNQYNYEYLQQQYQYNKDIYGYNYGVPLNNQHQNYYRPYGNQVNSYQNEEMQKLKLKYKIAGAFYGVEYTEDQLEDMVNPKRQISRISDEERAKINEYNQIRYLYTLFQQPPMYETNAQRTARCLYDMSYNFHKEFDDHGLCQFLEEDLWKLQREYWIKDNIKFNATRDLSRTYSSADYNELLSMHRSSNPYINQLLDTSRYDNNLDDMEIGLPSIFERERQKQILEGKVPEFISSDETQKRRHEWTNRILNQIYSKGAT